MSSRHISYVRSQDQSTLEIPPEDVGKIIGRGGSHIRELEAMYGASLRIRGTTLHISGPPECVQAARKGIQRLVGGGGVFILKDLDEKSLHSLLSVSDYLDQLQNQYDCYIEIGQRDIIIESAREVPEDAEKVQSLLQQKILELTELMTVAIAVWDTSLLSDVFNDAALTVLKDRTNLQMDIMKDDAGTGINLSGSRAAVLEAQEIIQGILAGEGRQAILPVLPGFLLDLDPALFEDLQQDICDHIERRFNVEVKYTINGNRFELAGAYESPEMMQDPIRILQEILIYYFPENCGLFFVRPIQAMDWICGRDDNQLVRLQGRECVISADKGLGIIWVCATDRQMTHVMSRLEKSLTDWKQTNFVIPLENPKIAGWIIGPGGEKLRQLQNETGATISCDDALVHIKGASEVEVEAARRAVQNVIAAWHDRSYVSSPPKSFGGNEGFAGGSGYMQTKITSGGFPTGGFRGGRGRGRGRGGRG
eukprot:Gregarina_sp_Pseudo_9__1197@NODE_178_length_3812_cov_31_438113_g164_i0_p1_GENE_NODE_178_length_3812_cov_31_438113_g164_i0NODE_178_length_3812_cov_31_438113_g164_i0_p1_ORF_typecomplete_len480_score42_09KH_1/PF00013_29/3_3e13KH_1/PF00013_29/81KH_1/PF00013_29/4_1e02KH_1/PF00013_29/8_9e10SLS/PF14611_6/9_5e05SLS/PF14611_6/4_6SLS/PF14611_6/0_29KH_2/PF07650_17/0_036KH_2/PF07650_17/1_3e04KH_2/PF07650_17/0_07KH_4/PF13083_6/0_024KH_4/PF13083_6/5_5e03KH_4/PF13083_6/6_7e03KH_4/PF13083_6/49KH_5/PF13184_6/1_6